MKQGTALFTGLVLAILVLAPLLLIGAEAFQPQPSSSPGAVSALQSLGQDRYFWEAFGGTLRLAGLATLFAVPVGLGIALLMNYAPPPARRLWEPLVLVPFLMPPYLTAVAWSLLAGPMGLIQQNVHAFGMPLESFLYSLAGMAAVMALHLSPLSYVLLRAALSNSDPVLFKAARIHGAGAMRAFATAILPGILPAMAAAALLIFLASAEEFGVPAVLSSYTGIRVLSTTVEEAMNVWPVDLPRAAAVGLILSLLGFVAWALYRPLAKDNRGQVGRRESTPCWWSLTPILAFVLLATLLPIGAIIAVSLEKAITAGFHPANLTWRHYGHILSSGSSAFLALRTSILLSLSVAIGTMLLALLSATVVHRGGAGSRWIDLLATLPNAFPGVVLAVGLILFWNAPWNPLPLYGHLAILGVAYATVTFPYAFRHARTGLSQVPTVLEQVGRVHGASPFGVFWRIRVPLAWPLLISGATVVFALSMRELVTSLLLQPPGVQVISTYVFNQFQQGNMGDGMAMSVIGVLSSALILGLARGTLQR